MIYWNEWCSALHYNPKWFRLWWSKSGWENTDKSKFEDFPDACFPRFRALASETANSYLKLDFSKMLDFLTMTSYFTIQKEEAVANIFGKYVYNILLVSHFSKTNPLYKEIYCRIYGTKPPLQAKQVTKGYIEECNKKSNSSWAMKKGARNRT